MKILIVASIIAFVGFTISLIVRPRQVLRLTTPRKDDRIHYISQTLGR